MANQHPAIEAFRARVVTAIADAVHDSAQILATAVVAQAGVERPDIAATVGVSPARIEPHLISSSTFVDAHYARAVEFGPKGHLFFRPAMAQAIPAMEQTLVRIASHS